MSTTKQILLASAVKSTTSEKYNRSWIRYIGACEDAELPSIPVTTESLSAFITKEFDNQSAFTSVELYLCGIMSIARQEKLPILVDQYTINNLKKGYRNLSPNPQSQDPISTEILRCFGKLVMKDNSLQLSPFNRLMVWASFLCAFYGLMRVSEYTEKLTRAHVRWESGSLQLILETTKNSPHEASHVWLAPSNESFMCPVANMTLYLKARDSFLPEHLPCFMFDNGDRYSAMKVNEYVLALSDKSGFSNTRRLSSHSFRIGGATEAARAGVNVKVIQAMGRWKSDCFLKYIRPAEKDIIDAQKMMHRQ